MDIKPPTVIRPGDNTQDTPTEVPVESTPSSTVPPSTPASPVADQPAKKPSKKRLLILAAAAVALIAGTTAYTFAYYLPNKPENIWRTSLSRSADGYDKLISYTEKVQKDKIFNKVELDGNFKFVADGASVDGTMSGVSDDKNGNLNFSVGANGQRITADLMMKDAATSEYPDLYVKLGGIKGLGAQFMGDDRLDKLNDQWVSVDHSIFDTMVAQAAKSEGVTAPKTEPKAEDIVAAAKVVGQQTRDYVFTTEPGKAVLSMDRFVGKETVDDVSANHYKAKVSKEHLKAYINSLATELDKTELGKWAKEMNDGKTLADTVKADEFTKEFDKFKDGQIFDLWINNDTKLIQKVKFENSEKPADDFAELGLKYKGGDEFPFYLNFRDFTGSSDEKMLGGMNFTLNTKDNTVKLAVNAEGEDKNKDNAVFNFNFKPSTKDIKTDAPASSMTFTEALNESGLSELMGAMSDPSAFYGDQSDTFSQSM